MRTHELGPAIEVSELQGCIFRIIVAWLLNLWYKSSPTPTLALLLLCLRTALSEPVFFALLWVRAPRAMWSEKRGAEQKAERGHTGQKNELETRDPPSVDEVLCVHRARQLKPEAGARGFEVASKLVCCSGFRGLGV